MKNKAFIGVIAASLVPGQAAMAQNKAVKATADRPNIIFILADDLGYGDLSCYGSKTIKTPNIDKLAATGTRFNQSYAGSGISSPSRCALMTGKNTGNSRIRDNMCTAGGMTGLKITPEGDTTIVRRTSLQPQDTTIATVLHAAGYKTCLVNKWHLDGYDPKSSPIYRGFDEFHGWLISTVESNSPYYYPYNRFDNDKLIHIKANEHDKHIKHNTDISTDDAINFIKRNKKNPFFLYLAFDAPHEPYIIDNTTWYDDESWIMNDICLRTSTACISCHCSMISRLIQTTEFSIGNSQANSVLRATVTGRLLPSSQTSLWNSTICVKTRKRSMISPRNIRKWLSVLTR
mgnify:CR=1 FL=1